MIFIFKMLDDKNITPSFVKQASCILQSDLLVLVLDLDFRFFYLNQCLAMGFFYFLI